MLIDHSPVTDVSLAAEVSNDTLHPVLAKFKDLFQDKTLPSAKLPGIAIHTEPGKIVHKSPYRIPLTKRLIVEEEI